MCRFVESIKLNDGNFYRLDLHQARVRKAFEKYYPDEEVLNITDTLSQYSFPQEGIFKCRIVFDSDVQSVEFAPYTRREIRSLQLVETELESFEYKLEDRSEMNAAFALRGDCDDVLLVRNGLLTDTSYANIALFDGKRWFTPKVPLLYGVNRADLLRQGKMNEKDINVSDLQNYKQITIFNAMIEFGEIVLNIEAIRI